jgi:phosphoribosyl-ATP pyrophosphohydrolase
MTVDPLRQLAETIRSRRGADPGQSYTQQLLARGPAVCARKFGEEAIELVVSALAEDKPAITAEAADVLYHLLVLLEAKGIDFDDVLKTLASRSAMSGMEEKASRDASSRGRTER